MAYYIDYDKCYGGLDIDNANSNKKTRVSINVETITQNDEQTTSLQRYIGTKEFLGHSFSNSANLVVDDFEFYKSTISLTLPYTDYPDLASARDIALGKIEFNGTYKSGNMGIDYLIFVDNVNDSAPFYSDLLYNNLAETSQQISYNETGDNIRSYSDVEEEINDYKNFTPSNGILNFGNDYPKFSFIKYDSYILLKIEFLSNIIRLSPERSMSQGIIGYNFYYYDYTLANITISYTSPTAESSGEQTIYGDVDNVNWNYEPDSFLFTTDNTIYGGLDYNSFYANDLIYKYKDGKQILKITIPVGYFSPYETDKDILEEDDECYLVRKVDNEYQSIYTDSSGNPQLYRVCYTNLNYAGSSKQEIHLEPIRSSQDADIYNVSGNTLNGLKEEYETTTTIADIPYEINGNIITEIADSAFLGNYGIEKIILPFTLTKIGAAAFQQITSIKTQIEFFSGLQSIGSNAFRSSSIKGDLAIPEGVTEIGAGAFADCLGLTGTLIIPSTFKFPSSASPGIFEGCQNLSRIIVYSDAINAPYNVTDFDDTGNCPIYVLDSLVDLFKQKFTNIDPNRFVSLSTLNT